MTESKKKSTERSVTKSGTRWWKKLFEKTRSYWKNSRRSKSATWTPSAHSSDIGIDQELIQPLVVESDNGLDVILVLRIGIWNSPGDIRALIASRGCRQTVSRSLQSL